MQGFHILRRYLSGPATQAPHPPDSDIDDSGPEGEDEDEDGFIEVDTPANVPADPLCDPLLYSPPSREELAYHTARNLAIDAKDLAQTTLEAAAATGIPQCAASLAATTATDGLAYLQQHLPTRDQLTTTFRAGATQYWRRCYLWRQQQPVASSNYPPRRPPSPGSSSIPMISERVDELPRSEWYRRPEGMAEEGFRPALVRALGEVRP